MDTASASLQGVDSSLTFPWTHALIRSPPGSMPEQSFSMSPEHARTASKPLINRSSAPADWLSKAPARARDAAKAFLAADPRFLLIAESGLTMSLAATYSAVKPAV